MNLSKLQQLNEHITQIRNKLFMKPTFPGIEKPVEMEEKIESERSIFMKKKPAKKVK